MRVETITRNVYTFDELSDRAKDRARAWYLEAIYDPSAITDTLTDALRDITGDQSAKVTGWSLGRYTFVTFTASWYVANMPERDGTWLGSLAPFPHDLGLTHVDVRASWMRDRNIITGVVDVPGVTPDDDDLATVQDALEEWLASLEAWLLACAVSEDEYRTSDDYILEMCDCNDWEFLENGAPA